MQAGRERMEQVRLRARSAARDLLRLARALHDRGVDVDALPAGQRDALAAVRPRLQTALARAAAGGDQDLAEAEAAIAGTRALLLSTRQAILGDLHRDHRLAVMEAMLAVEVADDDLEPVSTAGDAAADAEDRGEDDEEVAATRRRARQRAAARRRGELRRRQVESQAIDPEAPVLALLLAQPRQWTQAVCRAFGLTVNESAGAAARALADRRALATLVAGLRPAEREALGSLLDADGVMLTRALETRFGDSVEDGFDWHREPPTSVLGRLRSRGLCFVGRATLGPNLRSRPRVVVVPRDLRRLLGQVHRATPIPFVADRRVGEDAVETCAEVNDVEAETIRFERAQPELAVFCVGMAAGMAGKVGAGSLYFHAARVWAMFEAAFPGRVPRLRGRDLERARRASSRDLDAVERMHARLLERRVNTIVAAQPSLYAYLATAIEELAWSEEDKLRVFHACDTALRAFDAALR
ncbi:MAG TPA: hypothetical protein VKE22_01580 [Haliangiales bacterium]|nr:hypothetical protein [Haliangiales bacterium]